MLNISELLSAFKMGMIALEGAGDASHYITSGKFSGSLTREDRAMIKATAKQSRGFKRGGYSGDYSGKWPRKVPHQPAKPFRGGRGGGFAGGKCYVCYMPGHKAEVCPNRK